MKLEDFSLTNIATFVSPSLINPLTIDKFSIQELKIEDKITPEYNETYAFGKFDPIVSWKGTKRNITVSFKLKPETNALATIQTTMRNFALITLPKYSTGEAIYVQGAPIYKLNCFGYFDEYGIIKNLSVIPNYTPKKLFFSVSQEQFDNIGAGNSIITKEAGVSKYNFSELGISFDFTVLHKETPNLGGAKSSYENWPFIQ